MRRVLLTLISIVFLFSLLGCEQEEVPVGGGPSEITGSIVYVCDDGASLGSFWSESTEEKELTLTRGDTYRFALAPSFRGSKEAVYRGDCAEFTFDEGCCEVSYLGDEDYRPTYECTILSESDFSLTVTVDDYTQTISVCVVNEK